MPVIRVSDEVFMELEKRAVGFDTPENVIRRLLGLGKATEEHRAAKPVEGQSIMVDLTALPSARKYALIPIPKEHRGFFPGYKVPFVLETDAGQFEVHVTSGGKGDQPGDAEAGNYIMGGLKPFYDRHPELTAASKLHIQAIQPGKRYRLSIV